MSLEVVLKFTLQFEGGYVDDKDDPGGKTKYGITEATFDLAKRLGILKSESVKDLTEEEAKKIYDVMYYKPLRCDKMPDFVAVLVFDTAVNMGVNTSAKMLQETLNKIGFDVKVDAVIGEKTLEAIKGIEDKKEDFIIWFATIRANKYIDIIAKNDILKKYAIGWLRRVFSLQNYAMKLTG